MEIENEDKEDKYEEAKSASDKVEVISNEFIRNLRAIAKRVAWIRGSRTITDADVDRARAFILLTPAHLMEHLLPQNDIASVIASD